MNHLKTLAALVVGTLLLSSPARSDSEPHSPGPKNRTEIHIQPPKALTEHPKQKAKPDDSALDKPMTSMAEALRALHSPEVRVRFQGGLFLFHMGAKAEPAVPTILEVLTEENAGQRHELLHLLVGIGPGAKKAVPLLMKLTHHTDFHVRYLACRALGKIGPAAKPAVGILIAALKDPVTSVRRNAAEALGRLGPDVAPEAVEPLTTAVEDSRHVVRLAAILALVEYGERAKSAVPTLTKNAENKRSSERSEAARALWEATHQPKLVLRVLGEQLRKDDQPWTAAQVLIDLTPELPETIDVLAGALDGATVPAITAAEALKKLGPAARTARPQLKKLLTHIDLEVRSAAQEALDTIGEPK